MTEHNYRDHVIEVTENLHFKISGPEISPFRGRSTFASAAEAKAEIDKALALVEREKVSKFEARVLDQTGSQTVLKGINRTDGRVRGLAEGRYFWPQVEWLREVLKRHHKLCQEIILLNKQIEPFRLQAERTYGRIDADYYTRKLQELEKELQTKFDEASKIQPITAEPTEKVS